MTRKRYKDEHKQEVELKQAQREQLVNDQRSYAVALTHQKRELNEQRRQNKQEDKVFGEQESRKLEQDY